MTTSISTKNATLSCDISYLPTSMAYAYLAERTSACLDTLPAELVSEIALNLLPEATSPNLVPRDFLTFRLTSKRIAAVTLFILERRIDRIVTPPRDHRDQPKWQLKRLSVKGPLLTKLTSVQVFCTPFTLSQPINEELAAVQLPCLSRIKFQYLEIEAGPEALSGFLKAHEATLTYVDLADMVISITTNVPDAKVLLRRFSNTAQESGSRTLLAVQANAAWHSLLHSLRELPNLTDLVLSNLRCACVLTSLLPRQQVWSVMQWKPRKDSILPVLWRQPRYHHCNADSAFEEAGSRKDCVIAMLDRLLEGSAR